MAEVARKRTWLNVAASLRRSLGRATEPHVLFPAIGIVGLGVVWGTTLNLIRVERRAAERGAALSSSELAETYEAQVVRALREIDQTLKLVRYEEEAGGGQVLESLGARDLLPPDLLFVVGIADAQGDIVASTRPLPTPNVSGEDFFQSQRDQDALAVGRPRPGAGPGEWTLVFSRRLGASGREFSGVAIISVDAAYFASGYEASKLGANGVLGLVGTDGVFRVRRTGEVVTAGDSVDYARILGAAGDAERGAPPSINPWDGVRRYTSVRELFDFPLAIVVGLSLDEQLEPTRRARNAYLWRASAGTLLLILVVVALGRMSRQIALGRRRAAEEQVAHAQRVEYLAYHDGLTTLPNRSLFSKLLGQGIHQARRYGRPLATLFLDLDRFKYINDTLGHEAGDELLREVAVRVKSCLRESDSVARLGGDEFVVLLPEVAESQDAAVVARKILAALARPFVLLGQEFRVTASVGIAVYPQDGLDEQTLTKNADVAMYQAKAGGRNNFRFYSESMNVNTLERLALEARLRQALARNEFELHYQAKRDIVTGRVTGVEALLRWQHPELGTVAPMEFIPLAEETGLILPIGKWVLKTACEQNVAWQGQGLPPLTVAVNLTARQFSDEALLDDLAATLAATGMAPSLLELEIAESLLMRDVDEALTTLTRLKAMGIRLAVDNFGVGYASLSTLKRFPLNTIKIDRSFICDGATVAEDRTVTQAIVAMGRSLSLTVVALGVETREQAEFLHQNACDEFQGFYLNKPVPAGEITDLLRGSPPYLAGEREEASRG